MNENGVPSLETAVQFNLPTPRTIRKWRISLENESIDSLILKKKGIFPILVLTSHLCINRILFF